MSSDIQTEEARHEDAEGLPEQRVGSAREVLLEPLEHRDPIERARGGPGLVAEVAPDLLVVRGEAVIEESEVGEHHVGIAIAAVDPQELSSAGRERLREGVDEVDVELGGEPAELPVPGIDVLAVVLARLFVLEEAAERPTTSAQPLVARLVHGRAHASRRQEMGAREAGEAPANDGDRRLALGGGWERARPSAPAATSPAPATPAPFKN